MNRWKKLSCARRLGCWDVEDSAAATFRTALLLRPQASGQAFLEPTKRRHNRQMFEKESKQINPGHIFQTVSKVASTENGLWETMPAVRSQVRTGNALFAGAASGASWSFFPPKRWAPEKWQLQWQVAATKKERIGLRGS
ncbi:hypothetical protein QZM26_11300 [Burkholderia multivorans]|nr:hypothetical protein [Burkholderia multivorans]